MTNEKRNDSEESYGSLPQVKVDMLLSDVNEGNAADLMKKMRQEAEQSTKVQSSFQDEIDKMLDEIDVAPKNETSHNAAKLPAQSAAQSAAQDFYSDDYPHKCSKEQLSAIYKIHEKFVPFAVKTISAKFGKPVNISVAAIDQLTMNDLLRSIPNPTTLYIFNMKPLNGSAVMEIYFPVSSDVLPGLMSNLRTAWSEIINIQPSPEKTETNPDYINIAARSEGIVLVTLEAKNDSAEGMINIVYPYSVIKQINEKL